jgi:hypothetical protein
MKEVAEKAKKESEEIHRQYFKALHEAVCAQRAAWKK